MVWFVDRRGHSEYLLLLFTPLDLEVVPNQSTRRTADPFDNVTTIRALNAVQFPDPPGLFCSINPAPDA